MHGFGSAWGCNSPGRLDKSVARPLSVGAKPAKRTIDAASKRTTAAETLQAHARRHLIYCLFVAPFVTTRGQRQALNAKNINYINRLMVPP